MCGFLLRRSAVVCAQHINRSALDGKGFSVFLNGGFVMVAAAAGLRHSRAPIATREFGALRYCRLASFYNFRLNARVSQESESRRPRPPHNPGVRNLVEAKRRWSSPPEKENLKRGFRGWNERGYLPHRDEPGLTQFVTFRLKDSFPESLRSEWEHLLRIEDDRNRRVELENYLDRGRGQCFLRQSLIGGMVEDALQFFNDDRYILRAWVVMPNHVHVLFKTNATPMAEILNSWKKYISQKANQILGRRGAFWQADYWDTFMRGETHEMKTRKYIESNPVKAGLVIEAKTWPWSSARYRDEYDVLKL
jgi:REP element-mobilizing transposase RayT